MRKGFWLIKSVFYIFVFAIRALFLYDAVASILLRPPAVLMTPLDELIPFISGFAVLYVFVFYPFLLLTIGYYAFIKPEKSDRFFLALFAVYGVSFLTYLVFPVMMIRPSPDSLPPDFLSQVMANYYRSDPPLNCFPSLHAALSTLSAFFLAEETRNIALKVGVWGVAVGIMISTLFVRQHVIADEIAGFILAYVVGYLSNRYVPLTDVKVGYFKVRVAVALVLALLVAGWMISSYIP